MELAGELLEEALMFGDGCSAAEAKRLYTIFMRASSNHASDMTNAVSVSQPPSQSPQLTLDEFCSITELRHHPLRKQIFAAAQQFPPGLNKPGSLQFVQFVRLFHILSIDGLLASKIKLVYEVILGLGEGKFIGRGHLASFLALISDCEDDLLDYAVDQVFQEIAPGLDGINFATFRDLVVLTDSFVSSVCIPLALHSRGHGLQESDNDIDDAQVDNAEENADGDTAALEDLEDIGQLSVTV